MHSFLLLLLVVASSAIRTNCGTNGFLGYGRHCKTNHGNPTHQECLNYFLANENVIAYEWARLYGWLGHCQLTFAEHTTSCPGDKVWYQSWGFDRPQTLMQDGTCGTNGFYTHSEYKNAQREIAAAYNFAVPENTLNIGSVRAHDPDGDRLTYSVQGSYSISTAGFLKFLNAPDYETATTYNTIVTATDQGGLSGSAGVRITITDVEEAPVFGGDFRFDVAENQVNVGVVVAADPEDRTLTYSAGTGFTIDNQGYLQFVTAPDFEHLGAYQTTVTATDPAGNTATTNVFITVENVNEGPSFTSSNSFNVDENTLAVGTVTAQDPDAGATLTYSVDTDLFSIANDGALSFAQAPNYEVQSEYQVTVTVTDEHSLSASQTLVITINDVNEAPVFPGNGGGNVDIICPAEWIGGCTEWATPGRLITYWSIHTVAQCAQRCQNEADCAGFFLRRNTDSECVTARAGCTQSGDWRYQYYVVGRCSGIGHNCPASFPYPSHAHQNQICYNNYANANDGIGACGSWCTLNTAYGGGCGPNINHLCGAPTFSTTASLPGTNIAPSGIAFASSSLFNPYCDGTAAGRADDGIVRTGIHCFPNINDGLYGNSNSWIPNVGTSPAFVGIAFNNPTTFYGFAISRDNSGVYTDRFGGEKNLQFTTVSNPDHLSGNDVWMNVGNPFTMTTGLQQRYVFDQPITATGFRIQITNNAIDWAVDCIDELELFGEAQ